MKCSAVLGDEANEDMDFFMQFDTFNTILLPPSRPINHHYTHVSKHHHLFKVKHKE